MKRGTVLSIAFSSLFIYLFLFSPAPSRLFEEGPITAFFSSRVDWPGVGRIMLEMKWLPFSGALACLIFSLVIRAWRWRVIVAPVKRLPVPLFFHLTNLGYMANNLLPMRLGEVLRGMALKARGQVDLSASLASIVLERFLDMLGAAVMLMLLLLLGPPLAGGADGGSVIAGFAGLLPTLGLGGSLACLLLLGLVLFRERLLLALEKVLIRFLPAGPAARLHRMADTFADGLSILASPWEALLLLLQTAILYSCYLGSLAFMLATFGFTAATLPALSLAPFAAVVMLLVFVSMGYMIPAAPGALGTVQYFTLLALQLMGDDGARAQSFALGNHLLTWLVLTLLGLAALPALKLNFHSLLEWKKERA
jgi:uncharacterized protein (TIRG00374 family)